MAGIAVLALAPLTVLAPATAAGDNPGADRARTAAALRLGDQESLVVRDVVVDANGAEHVRYDRTYAGLRVIGGDLVVHESPAGDVRTVSWASPDRIVVAGTTPAISGGEAQRSRERQRGP